MMKSYTKQLGVSYQTHHDVSVYSLTTLLAIMLTSWWVWVRDYGRVDDIRGRPSRLLAWFKRLYTTLFEATLASTAVEVNKDRLLRYSLGLRPERGRSLGPFLAHCSRLLLFAPILEGNLRHALTFSRDTELTIYLHSLYKS